MDKSFVSFNQPENQSKKQSEQKHSETVMQTSFAMVVSNQRNNEMISSEVPHKSSH